MTASKLDGFILPAHEIAQQIASNLSVTDVLNALCSAVIIHVAKLPTSKMFLSRSELLLQSRARILSQ
jgi:hypothetical protein